MTLTQLAPPYPIFTDRDGSPLDAGYLYFGEVNQNPETNPIQVYYDTAFTIPAAQPLRTSNGYVMRNGSPALIYADNQFSVTVRNKKNELVIYSPAGFGVVPFAPSTFATSDQVVRDVAALLADVQFTYTAGVPNTVQVFAGDILRTLAEGFAYEVAPAAATNQNVATAGGVKLYVQPGSSGYDVKAFGAVGDGVADDTVEVQKALDAVASGGELFFPQGVYRITTGLAKTYADGVSVSVRGYGAKIDATGIGTFTAMEIGGSRVSSTGLGANATKNSDIFTVASASGILKNRILLITSTDLFLPTAPNYFKGELALVEEISGTTITNSNPLYDSYTAATTTVHLLNMPQITVEGLEIECDGDVIALQILYSRNPVVRNCKVHGSRYAAVYVGYCLGGTVDSNFIYDVWNGVVTGTSYGVVVGTGQGVKVVNNTINNARHAISGGGFEPLREVVYSSNTCHNSSLEINVGCIDIHANVEYALITGNIASSVICQGINATISNNILRNNEDFIPTILIFQLLDSDFFIIKGNRVTHTSTDVSAFGISIRQSSNNLNIKNLVIEGNCVDTVSRAVSIQPRSPSITGSTIDVFSISGNQLRCTGALPAFALVNSVSATITVGELISSGNIYHAENFDAFICQSNPITTTISVGDTFKGNRATGYLAYFCGTNVRLTSPSFYGNTGGSGNSRSVYYENTGRIDVTNPVFSGLTFKAEVASATEYVENGWHSITPGILNTSGARLINFYGALGRATTYGTAAPTTRTWAVGDRVINDTPSIGQPKSWVCTLAGTPGTWVSEGNL